MNNWATGYCYSPARSLPSLQSPLFGASGSAEHGLSDRTSEAGQRLSRSTGVTESFFYWERMTCVCKCPLCLSLELPAMPLCPLSSACTRLAWRPAICPDGGQQGSPPPSPCQWSAAPLSVSETQLWPICPVEKRTRVGREASALPRKAKVRMFVTIPQTSPLHFCLLLFYLEN